MLNIKFIGSLLTSDSQLLLVENFIAYSSTRSKPTRPARKCSMNHLCEPGIYSCTVFPDYSKFILFLFVVTSFLGRVACRKWGLLIGYLGIAYFLNGVAIPRGIASSTTGTAIGRLLADRSRGREREVKPN